VVFDAVQLSVVVVTYNHAPYIAQAIESVLAQQTSRPMEIIVSEDCSTDGTREIVRDFAARDPRIQLLLSPANLRSNEVVARGIRAARGRYIALLDGDDYWTSPTKLERQASILDADPSLSACFHNAATLPSGERWTPAGQPSRVTLADIWQGNPFATCAGMMRASALADLGDWYHGFFPITDWPLYILCAEHGDIAFSDELVGAYRLHEGGLFSALPGSRKLDMIAGFYKRMGKALGARSRDFARAGASRYFFDWTKAYAASGDRAMARHCLARSLRGGGVGRSVSRREWVRAAWRLR
jgi:glycosyltransferase involved in cell wall biosynthesis